MRYADLTPGMHIVRTRELSWARKLSGVICLVREVSTDKIHVQVTADCVPVGNVLAVPAEGDDGYWYDVSELVMEANSAILPAGDTDAYDCPVEANYRNFVGCDGVKPFVGQDAVGNVCLIGERQKTGRVAFSKTGYYVVSMDVNGYAAVFQGFCEYLDSNASRKLSLRILNLSNTERAFYPANAIVDACHQAFSEDCSKADSYRGEIRESTITSSAESDFSPYSGPGVGRMSLEGQL